MNIFICDDDSIFIEHLQKLLNEFFEKKRVHDIRFYRFNCGEDVLNSPIPPDLAFLDVEMTGISGTHVGRELQCKNPEVKIFIVTSHIDYLDEAFRFSFFRYLLKPINKSQLYRNVTDVFHQRKVELKEIEVKTKTGSRILKLMDIIAIKVDNRGVLLFLREGTLFSINTISSLEEPLDVHSFFRTHRDYIVNLKYVKSYDKSTVLLEYGETQIEAYLSKLRLPDFKRAFLWYRERVYDSI